MKILFVTLTLALALCACSNTEIQGTAPVSNANAVDQDSDFGGTLARSAALKSMCASVELVGSWNQLNSIETFSVDGTDFMLSDDTAGSIVQSKVLLNRATCSLQKGTSYFKITSVEVSKISIAPCTDRTCETLVYSESFALTRK